MQKKKASVWLVCDLMVSFSFDLNYMCTRLFQLLHHFALFITVYNFFIN